MTVSSKAVGAVLALAVLAGCGHTEIGPGFTERVATLDPDQFTCCADPERFYPDVVVRTAFALSDRLGPAMGKAMHGRYQAEGYPGRLAGSAAAQAALSNELQPLDLVFLANKSFTWGRLIPGRFTHVGIYLGTEPQLRAAGLWSAPGLAPYHGDIRAGRLVFQSVTPVAELTDLARTTQADAVAILRPQLTPGERRAALTALVGMIGAPYDYTYDVTTSDRVSCSEVVAFAMPGLGLDTQIAYGKEVVFPDAIVAQAIRGERMQVVGYMVGTEDGFAWRGTGSLMADIAAHWGVPQSGR